ncbi:MAG: STAS domain-containing protein [Lachnospiraceae bacterium]|jgi:fatty-acyl-CoA synthase|nr:STAS domain-containing protein [Lachnospiraceae bacterium]
MRINEEKNGKELIIALEGRLDTTTAPELREHITAIPEEITHLVMDFKDLAYISSAGLREILVCRKRFRDDAMRVINVSEAVNEIFETTGFDELIPLEVTCEDISTYVNLSFKDFLKKKVENTPDAVALVDERGDFTWKDVDVYSQIIAEGLEKKGVKRGTHIAICGANSVNWVLTFFAIQKLGAMAQLLNSNMRASEIATVAGIGDITHLCYGMMPEMKDEEAFIKEIKEQGCPLTKFISIRDDRQDIRERRGEYEAIQHKFGEHVEADAPCVMIFTSGSTGRPKGVLLSAYNILNAASSSYKDQTLTEQDKTCLILPLFHIFGLVAGLFANAMAGSTIYLPKNIRTDTLLELIEKEKCTIFHSVPTMLIALLNNKNFVPEKFATLRCTIISGAAATQAQIKMFKEKLPNDHFMASYGLSEMAPVSITVYGDTEEHLLNTVGKPVSNISIKIRNMENGEDCPVNVSGEVLVQGYNLMTGYYKVSLEDQAIDEDGWLRTGDLGFLDEEGYLHLSGRLKELIIRGGENIMPGEVEAAISTLEMIDNVKVIGVPSEFFGEEVCACLKLKKGYTFSEEEIKEQLAGKLAKFKIPSHYVIYEEFPMLGTGKIDGVTLKKEVFEKIK